MMAWITNPVIWLSLLTLTVLEIVLGIDNLIFLSILTGRLPVKKQANARRLGLTLALALRILLLLSIVWVMRSTKPLFAIVGHSFSWRDLILVGGGVFLLYKATQEIHANIEGEAPEPREDSRQKSRIVLTVVQIGLLDIVFSFDSVITAVGMTDNFFVMVAAVTIAMAIMLFASEPVSTFVELHPTVKMLALSFLLLIGMTLIADGMGAHVPKGYIYAAIAFSMMVEFLNQLAGRAKPSRRG